MSTELKAAIETARAALDRIEELQSRRDEPIAAFNETARRLRNAETREEWIQTILEAAKPYCAKAALFRLTPRGLSMGGHPEVPLKSAPAFQSAVETRDTVVAVGSPREVSQTIAATLGDASRKKIYLFPVLVRQEAVAVLYTEPGEGKPVNVSALELLASLAGVSTEPAAIVAAPVQPKRPALELVSIAGVKPPRPKPEPPAVQEHLRAQRFARTKVAEMVLHKPTEVRQGRESNDLYSTLKEEIETGREAFRSQFVESCPSMVDYFHQELQRTLAQDTPGALGPGYPGPLPLGPGTGAA